MDMITLKLKSGIFYIKNGARVFIGPERFRFLDGMLFIEKTEVFNGLVLQPFSVYIFKLALENPESSWSVAYPTKNKSAECSCNPYQLENYGCICKGAK